MTNNKFEELMKIAAGLDEGPTMNALANPSQPSVEDAQVAQSENDLLLNEMIPNEVSEAQLSEDELALMAEDQAAQQILEEAEVVDAEVTAEAQQELAQENLEQGIPEESLREELEEKVASELMAFGTIAKLVECSVGGDDISEELQKQANAILFEMTESEESFGPLLDKTANELFAEEGNLDELYTPAGLKFVFEQLAFLDSEEFEKVANEEGGALNNLKAFAGNAIDATKQKVKDAVYAATHLTQIGNEIAEMGSQLSQMDDQMLVAPETVDKDLYNRLAQELPQKQALRRSGQAVVAGGAGLAAAGALYGGKKLYDHMHTEEKVATVLPAHNGDGTLDLETQSELNGGIQKMSKELVYDFLKVAGAAGLVGIANNEELDTDLRKEAAEAFNEFAKMDRQSMDDSFVKVAQTIFTEYELHEIVSGHHTGSLVEKVAFFVEAADQSTTELEKIASAGGVADVKHVGASLKDATATISAATVAAAKSESEEAGGQLEDNRSASEKQELDADNARAYNVINNPSEYGVEQTASALREAVMLKLAAENFIDALSK